MVESMQLLLPVVLSAVLIFIASSIIHMLLKWHQNEYSPLPDEDATAEVLRKQNLPPGQYMLPGCRDMKDMGTEAMQQKFKNGPVGLIVIRQPGAPSMGKPLLLWFLFNLAVAFVAAQVARVLPPGASSHLIAHTTALVTFVAYCGGSFQNAIWMGKLWGSVLKDMLDALIFAAITAACFAYCWPH